MINALEVYRKLADQWNTTSQPLKERASVLPLGQYEDGSVGLAWPGLLAAPAEGVMNFGSQGFGEEAVPYNSRMAFDAAGGAMTGGLGLGLAGGMADNALGSAGAKLTQSASPALASRDMQQMARSLGYDTQRVRSWASDKINELSRSTWDSDKAEAARLGQLLQELDADPNALAAIRQGERSSVLQSQAQRQQNRTERPIANRDGYKIVRRDDPDVGALNFDILGPDGGSVGSAKMSASQGQVENPEIGWVGIDEAHQRKGLASWLYDEIERDIGQKLWPSPELISPEIQAFWQKRDPDRLARMLAGTYANAPTGSSVPLSMNALERAQRARVKVSDYPVEPNAKLIDDLYTDPAARGQGLARQAMEDVTRQADADRSPLYLNTVAGDGVDPQRLIEFYKSLGFESLGPSYMRRNPAAANAPTASAIPLANESTSAADGEAALLTYLRSVGLY
jgi:GNAT superfamily N-acetyltransferase